MTNSVVEAAIGGMTLTTIEGRERFSVNARYAQEYRSSLRIEEVASANNGIRSNTTINCR
jgi:Cu/Ag efflux pump CusA